MQSFEWHQHFREGRGSVEGDELFGRSQTSLTVENIEKVYAVEQYFQKWHVAFRVVDSNLQMRLKVHLRLNERTWLKMDSINVLKTFTSDCKSLLLPRGLISKEDVFQQFNCNTLDSFKTQEKNDLVNCKKSIHINVNELPDIYRDPLKQKLLGAVDTRRYPRTENRVWSDQEDHVERGSKDRAASTCGPHSDSFNDTSRRRRSNCSINNFQTPCGSNLKSKCPFRALPLTPEHRQLRLQWCQARSMWNVTDWQKVVFSDESRFVLGTDDNRVRVWSHPGEQRYNFPTLFYVTLPAQLV
ncbi:hypothetical protein TNCV_836131 [Trichonephila clavipes]|nr:hypothetical protein TNCV_836131 [Trichonephila clavipes]